MTNNSMRTTVNYAIYLNTNASNNLFTGNTITNSAYGIYLRDNSSNNLFTRNTLTNYSNGIDVGGSTENNTFNSNTFQGTTNWFDMHIESSSYNNIFTNNLVGINYPTTFSILSYNGTPHVLLTDNTGANPTGLINISKYLNVSNGVGNWINLRINYTDADVAPGGVQEATLAMYRYNGSIWNLINGSTLNATNNFVTANISNYSTFGLFGTYRSVPTTVRTSGGGGGGRASTIVLPLNFDLDMTVKKKLRKFNFFFFDLKTERHKFTIKDVNGPANEVTVTIASTPKDYVLGIGKVTNIDVDGDGKYDIIVTLDGIEYGTATITIEKYKTSFIPRPIMPQPVQETKETQPQPKQTTDTTMPERQKMMPQIEKKGTNWYWWVGLAIIAIILLIWIASSMKKGSKPKKKKK